jgi:hypothetical protein
MGGGHTEILVGLPAAGFSDAENGHRHKPAPGHGHGHGLGIVRIYQEQAMDPLQQTLSLSDRLPVETTPATTELALYTRFTRRQKQFILAMVTWAGLFSPLTANIYFPALAELAADMGVSESRIDLTVTTYMIFQGISPNDYPVYTIK